MGEWYKAGIITEEERHMMHEGKVPWVLRGLRVDRGGHVGEEKQKHRTIALTCDLSQILSICPTDGGDNVPRPPV